MTEFVQRKPFVFLMVLVLTNLFLLSVQIRNEQGLTLLHSWELTLFTPMASSIHGVTSKIENAVSRYVYLHNAQQENERLIHENAQLKLELIQLRGLKSLFLRARDYELIRNQYVFDTLPVAVIWRNARFYSQRFVVNAGIAQGVMRDAAVITPEGIVGRIWAVSRDSSEVELLTNNGAAAGGMLNDSRMQGVVQGNGSELLNWNFIPNYEQVKVGDLVYTSGTDRIYPRGLLIGQVLKSEKSRMIYRDVVIRPRPDYSRLEEVMVVVHRE
ncbi:MAG: rod shape-determining protein MreC [Acidobacteria bacterium]|nr:rod shape-determining protein MreC [Acidobacteriota bacterium]